MKVAFSGHQDRPGIRWAWVATAIRQQLASLKTNITGLCCLAAGSDQVFAGELLASRGTLTAVIPRDDYASFFTKSSDLAAFEKLKARASSVVELHLSGTPEETFLRASQFMVNDAPMLLAVWDEQPSQGLGGTADVVKYAIEAKRRVMIINPIEKTSRWKVS